MDVTITIPAQTVTIPSQNVDAVIPAAKIVYQNSWLGQTSALGSSGSPVSTLSFSSSGQYRISVALEVVGTGAYVQVYVWDSYLSGLLDVQVISNSPNFTDVSGGKDNSIVASLGQTMTFYTTITNASQLNHYNLYLTIEQLQ